MRVEELKDLVQNTRQLRTETQKLELKKATGGCPKLFDTLSSFSNQDGGGTILFGIDEDHDFAITGVYDVNDLQKQVVCQCKQMEPAVRALFTICEIEGKGVVAAEIPGVDISERPVFYRGVGRIRGSYVRVGEADEPMSEYEVYSYEAFRKRLRDDVRVVDHAQWTMMDEKRLTRYLVAVKTERPNLGTNVSDEEILRLMGVRMEEKPTLTGLLAFSRYPQAYFSQLCIIAVSLPGVEQGVVGDDGERFIDNKRITGAIPEMLEEAVEFVRRNGRTKTIINENGQRVDKPEYPIRAIREAVLNALVHRDYSTHTENTPICIEMYRDRIEITNPGGLYGKLTIDALGKVRPETRNPALANVLELLKVTENRYSGIPTMRTETMKAGLPAPVFSVHHGEFKVVMKNGIFSSSNSLEDALLDYCVIPRTRGEIVAFVGKSSNYVAAKIIAPLVEAGRLALTLPEKPQSSKQRFFNPNSNM